MANMTTSLCTSQPLSMTTASISSSRATYCQSRLPPLLLLLLVLFLELLLAVEAEAVVLRPSPGELLVGGGW